VKGRVTAGRSSGRRRIRIALAAATAALPLLFGVWVIIRDKSGQEIGRIQVPEGGSVEQVDEHGQPMKPKAASSVTPKPVRIEIQSEPCSQPEPFSHARTSHHCPACPGRMMFPCG
jgi:hypothetical protein